MNLQDYCQQALARAEVRHTANGLDMLALYHHNGSVWVVQVMRHIVLVTESMREVEAFCMMHNRVY